ncbi:hypothetical protein TWF481_004545 [Arthrobotrys musiformis]|uniref:CCHC-type domain-containing protein n=1 Tax=Arthrobotrys musiformis TaxID=47236 RepID=A0AAV9WJV9_9PEZI
MASSSTSQASKPVSSRLLNMKFMQKPHSSTSSTPSSKHQSPSSSAPSKSKPSSSSTTPKNSVSRSAILAAQALESSRREAAINSSAVGASERWFLSLPASERANEIRGGGEMVNGVRVYTAGHTLWGHDDDSSDEEEVPPPAPARRYFGGRAPPVVEKKSTEDTDSDDAPDSDDETSASEAEVLRRVESKRAAKALKKEKEADKTLRNLKQIGGRAKTTGSSDMECFACGEKGHRKSDCPNLGSRDGKGRPAKAGRGNGGVKRGYSSFDGPAIKKQRRY